MHQHQHPIPSVAASKPEVVAAGMKQEFSRSQPGMLNILTAIWMISGILIIILVLLFVR